MKFLMLLLFVSCFGCHYSKNKQFKEESGLKFTNVIEANPECNIYEILNSNSDNPLEWKIKPTTLQLIPDGLGHYLTKAYRVDKNGSYQSAFINISTPERIVDYVIYNLKNPIYSNVPDASGIEVIPSVASDCFGSYEVYYSRNNPELSIEILKKGLEISIGKNVIAEDLGYILRDENRLEEALEYFLISEQNGSSSNFILGEIENIYRSLGNKKKADEYKLKI